MIYTLFLYIRYYCMSLLGYKGAFLFYDTNPNSVERWKNKIIWSRFFPVILTRDNHTTYWYSAKELKEDFHNSKDGRKDRERDV